MNAVQIYEAPIAVIAVMRLGAYKYHLRTQLEHLEGHLREEQQQHDLTRLKLSKAEASLREALSRAAAHADSAHSSASAREQRLQQQVQGLTQELMEARDSAQANAGLSAGASADDSQLQRAQRDAVDAEESRQSMSRECGELRKQLTESNQRILVRHPSSPLHLRVVDKEVRCASVDRMVGVAARWQT